MGIDSKILAVCGVLFLIKFYITLCIQGNKRFAGGSRPPEDQQLTQLTQGQSQSYGLENVSEQAKVEDIRWQRIVMNDLENIPMGLLMAVISVLVGGNSFVNSLFFITFTVCRFAHTYCYAYELQPYRSYIWIGGVLSVFVIGFNALVAAIFY